MDDLNNNKNPFNEENSGQNSGASPYNEPYAGQTNSQPYTNPYADQNSGQYQNPYTNGNAGQQDPYHMPSGGNQYSPYNNVQPQQNPYQQYGQTPPQGYAMPSAGYQQQNYGYGQPYMPYQVKPPVGMAVASLVLGITSLVMGIFMFTLPVLFLVPVIGLILGIVFKTKRLPVGKGLSTAGIVTSSLGLVLPLLLLIIVIMWMVSSNGTEFMRSYMERLKETNPEQYKEYYNQMSGTFPQWFSDAARYIRMLLKLI